jgi:hypothetical protein
VRRFASTDKPEPVKAKELNVPVYWIKPPQILSSDPGRHRFVWDLHYPPPEALEREYPISAIYQLTPRYPLGPSVVPGKYTVKLTVAGNSYTQVLTIRMDPRVKTSSEDLRHQFEIATKIADAMHRDYQALEEVRGVRARLKQLPAKAGQGALGEAIAALQKRAEELEGNAGGYRAVFLTDAAGKSLARLNGALNQLLATVDSADAAPSARAISMFAAVESALEQQLANWKEIKSRDIPALNLRLRQANMKEIRVGSPAGP